MKLQMLLISGTSFYFTGKLNLYYLCRVIYLHSVGVNLPEQKYDSCSVLVISLFTTTLDQFKELKSLVPRIEIFFQDTSGSKADLGNMFYRPMGFSQYYRPPRLCGRRVGLTTLPPSVSRLSK
jgi:hypothetical protein